MNKLTHSLVLTVIILLAGCREVENETLEVTTENQDLLVFGTSNFPNLSDKKSVFRMSYQATTMTQRKFADGNESEDPVLLASLEPHETKQMHYYEVYDDFSMAHAVENLDPVPTPTNARTEDISASKATFFKDVDGIVTTYNSKGELLATIPSAPTYFDGADEFESAEALGEYLYQKTVKPQWVKEKTLAVFKASAARVENKENGIIVRMDGGNSAARIENNGLADYYEVTLNEEYGVPVYEIGYTNDGSMVDKNAYFYTFTADSSLVLAAEQYQVLRFSQALEEDYVSTTNTFYDNHYAESL